MQKIVLATFGTHGDLNPFIAVAQALKVQGFRPVIATSPEYRPKVNAAGIEFHDVRPSFEQIYRDLGADEATLLQRAIADQAYIFRDVTFPYLRVTYEDMLAVLDGAQLVLTSTLAFGARLAAEKLGVPQVGVVLQPILFVSRYDPGMNPHAVTLSKILRRLGPGVVGTAVGLLKRMANGWARPVAAFRQEIGLPPDTRNLVFDAQYSPLGTLAMYSPVLGGVQPDYPPNVSITGFVFHDDDPEASSETSDALSKFLAAGSPPLAFVLGSSAHVDAGDFFEVSLEAARAIGRRAVIVTGVPRGANGASVASVSPEVFACRYARYSQLFERAAAVVHQGGVGTLAQALRSGRPQIVVPFHADQLDNGTRAERLGAGRVIMRAKYRTRHVASELQRVLSDPSYARAAAGVAEQVAAEQGIENTVAAIRGILATIR